MHIIIWISTFQSTKSYRLHLPQEDFLSHINEAHGIDLADGTRSKGDLLGGKRRKKQDESPMMVKRMSRMVWIMRRPKPQRLASIPYPCRKVYQSFCLNPGELKASSCNKTLFQHYYTNRVPIKQPQHTSLTSKGTVSRWPCLLQPNLGLDEIGQQPEQQ